LHLNRSQNEFHIVRPVAEAELPQRFRRAEEVYQRKFWREQLCDWNETFKPKAIKARREL
jgi:pyruvate,water dikinase